MPSLASGGGITFDDFFAAIGGQESGGDYGAVNSRTGAAGKYQIMPSNIGPWSQQYLGRRISVSEFKSSPQLQEELARAVLRDYFGKYGARGAAAAWYSGNPNRADDYGSIGHGSEPSVGKYVDQVLARVGRGGGSAAPSQPFAAPQPPGAPGLADPLPDVLGPGTVSGVDAIEVHPDQLGRTFNQQSQQSSGLPTTQPTLGGGRNTGSDPTRDGIISEAMRYIGTPYVWGGTSPSGFDCSGIIKYVYGKFGIDMPRISADQARMGRRTSIDQLRPGDLVATDNSSRHAGADHIAIYIGNGQILEAPHAGANVRVRHLGANENYWGVALDI